MRLWTGFVLGAIGLVAVGWGVDSVAGDSTAVRGDLGAALDRAAHAEAAAGFVGAVLVVRGDEVLLARGYGAADPVSGRPVEPDTLFDIGSVTKPITALAVLCLAADGKLSLDDPIGKHLAGVPSPRRGITVRQLLGHTSGLGGVYPAAKADRKSFVSGFLALATAGAPGEGFAYSNPGYTLLAAIVEEVSGRGFEEYVRERIFSRAGMADSGFIQGAGVEEDRSARRILEGKDIGSARTYAYGWGFRGATGVVTHVLDLWRLEQALRAGGILPAEQLAPAFVPGSGGYGLGWFADSLGGRARQWHGGTSAGFEAYVSRVPEAGAFVAVLERGSGHAGNLGRRLETVLGLDRAPAFAGPAAALAGEYAHSSGARLEVTSEEAGLVLGAIGQTAVSLLIYGGDYRRGLEFLEGVGERGVFLVDAAIRGAKEASPAVTAAFASARAELGAPKGVRAVGSTTGGDGMFSHLLVTFEKGEARYVIAWAARELGSFTRAEGRAACTVPLERGEDGSCSLTTRYNRESLRVRFEAAEGGVPRALVVQLPRAAELRFERVD